MKYFFIIFFLYASVSWPLQDNDDSLPYQIRCRVNDRQPMKSDCTQHILFSTGGMAKFSNGKAKLGIWGPGSPTGELTDYFLHADDKTKKMEVRIVRRINENFLTYKTQADYSKIGDSVNLDFDFGDEKCISRKVNFRCTLEKGE